VRPAVGEPAAGIDLPRDRVDVWMVHLPLESRAPLIDDRWLSAEEHRHADAFIRPTSRLQRLVGFAARRAVLSLYLHRDPAAWHFVTGMRGRPDLVPTPGVPFLSVSLSHTDGLVVLAVTEAGDVGIDVERIEPRRRIVEIAKRCFASEETAALRTASTERRPVLFATLWILKESYLKARGVGIWGGIELASRSMATTVSTSAFIRRRTRTTVRTSGGSSC
jgi:phosphopantetheinyl transferase